MKNETKLCKETKKLRNDHFYAKLTMSRGFYSRDRGKMNSVNLGRNLSCAKKIRGYLNLRHFIYLVFIKKDALFLRITNLSVG